MKALFLASGKSSRMKPFSEKNFLKFFGEPLCLHLLRNAMKGGVTEFVVVSNGENKEKLEALIQKENINGKVVVQKDLSKGMAGGIIDGLVEFEDEERVLILGGNDFFPHEKIKETIASLADFDGAVLAHKVSAYFPGGYLTLNKDHKNRVNGIIEKPGAGNEPSDLVNIICHGFSEVKMLKDALKKAKSSNDDVYEVALDAIFKSKKVKAVRNGGKWQAVKYPWHIYAMAQEIFDEKFKEKKIKIDPEAEIHPTAIIGEAVIIEKGVKVYPYACIGGKTHLAEGTVIGNGALVRDSFISQNCGVGYNSEIARSFLFNNVSTHIAYVGDSVVGENVNFGAFSCTANLRLDQQNVKVRVKDEKIDCGKQKCGAFVGNGAQIASHGVLMPGQIIAKDTFFLGTKNKSTKNEVRLGDK